MGMSKAAKFAASVDAIMSENGITPADMLCVFAGGLVDLPVQQWGAYIAEMRQDAERFREAARAALAEECDCSECRPPQAAKKDAKADLAIRAIRFSGPVGEA
jgi:hypothetical protein